MSLCSGLQTYKVMSHDPPRTLRWLSTGSGVLLILGGIAGAFTINPLSMIISIYNVMFGILIVLTELKNFPIIKTFQKKVDLYFHLLSVPRGKGGFYCFIGFLAFFSSDWSLARICVLIVSIVGVLHLFACKRCGAPGDTEQDVPMPAQQPMESYAEAGSCGSGGADAEISWSGLMKQVVADSPEVLSAGIKYGLSGGGGAAAAAGGVMTGSINSSATSGLQQPPPAAGAAESGNGGGGSGIDGVPKSVMTG